MTDQRWIVLRLEAPLMAFGGVRIDQIGPTRDFPAASMLTGLLANALGFTRSEWQKHQALQDRLVFAAHLEQDKASAILTDVQNAGLEKTDKGWTTCGEPQGRDGGSYGGPHRRFRDFHMDARATVVFTLRSGDGEPNLDLLAKALQWPVRPLFIGRKPCLPAGPLFQKIIEAPSAYVALCKATQADSVTHRALWPMGEGPSDGVEVDRIIELPDLRNWRSGLHGGSRQVVEGRIMQEGVVP
jgi:CRISPR system Cascade subunit CasD